MHQTSRQHRIRTTLLAATIVAVAAQAAHALTGFGSPSVDRFFADELYVAIEVAGVLACGLRAALVRQHRTAWWLITVAFACWTFGDAIWVLDPDPGYPSLADGFYLLFFPLCCAGVALLASNGRDHVAARMWLDGLIAALATAALIVALVFGTIVGATDGSAAQTIVNLAYPLGDLVLIGFVLTVFATKAWRPGAGWLLLGFGASLTAVADTIFLYQDALGTYRDGSFLDVLWPATVLCCGWAAWQPWERPRRSYGYGRQTFVVPTAFTLLALGILTYGQFAAVSHAGALLACAALVVAIARAGITFRENVRLLHATRHEALTDGLTGLPNRRRLMRDLEDAVYAGRTGHVATFAFFDLDGFKSYNDAFGHAAGDTLLDRLASRLALVVQGYGSAYRLGGDEFCVLLDGHFAADGELISACSDALQEQGEGFQVGCSLGVVAIPAEADSATHALQLADQRMYAAKDDSRRSSSRRQTRDVLLQVLREREPDLHRHLHGVAALSVAVARELQLTAEQQDELARAAELHDIGKLAIPDEILHKPGPLDEAEWELMHQHTVIGDRILAAAPAMRPVAAIVRSSHERWDGNGYPDRIAGEAIPLGARIVAVCDAFHAMTSERTYQRTMSNEDALAELARCAGTQFDPAVVEVFVTVARSRAADVGSTQRISL